MVKLKYKKPGGALAPFRTVGIFGGLFVVVVAVAGLVGATVGGSAGLTIFWGGAIALVIYYFKKQLVAKKPIESELNMMGMKPEHFGSGFIDIANKKLVGGIETGEYAVFDFDEIKTWKLEWTEKNAQKSEARIVFELNNFEVPILRIGFFSYPEAEKWESRMGTLING